MISSPFDKEISSKFFTDSFIDLLKSINKKIIILGPPPNAPFNVGQCIFKSKIFRSTECSFSVSEQHNLKINNLKKILQNTNVIFIDITDFICPANKCTMKIEKNNSLYIDKGHLSFIGASRVVRNFFKSNF